MKISKFNCMHCGQSLEADETLFYTELNCPRCTNLILVPSQALERMPLPEFLKHIEFQKMRKTPVKIKFDTLYESLLNKNSQKTPWTEDKKWTPLEKAIGIIASILMISLCTVATIQDLHSNGRNHDGSPKSYGSSHTTSSQPATSQSAAPGIGDSMYRILDYHGSRKENVDVIYDHTGRTGISVDYVRVRIVEAGNMTYRLVDKRITVASHK